MVIGRNSVSMSLDSSFREHSQEPAVVASAGKRKEEQLGASSLYAFRSPAMGTEFTLHLYASSQNAAYCTARDAFEEVHRIERLLSHYRPDSELSRISREAFDHEVTTDPETFGFLESAFGWSELSGGAFDITVGRLMKAWGFFGDSGRVPTEQEISSLRGQMGWRYVRLNPDRRTVRFLAPGIELDPGGIGKGYAVDRMVRVLEDEAVTAALISAGSSTLYAVAAPPGEPGWKVHVPAPGRPEQILSTVYLRDTSLSTASYTEKRFSVGERIYGSIMSPETLAPVESVAQVTAVAPTATDSDALSNVLFVLSGPARTALLESLLEVSALVMTAGEGTALPEATRWPAPIVTEEGSLSLRIEGG